MASYVIAWPTLGIALIVFGFAPGAVLRLILLIYPRGNARRKELVGELYAVPRLERPFWVAEQFEVAISEGLRDRILAWRLRRASDKTGIASRFARALLFILLRKTLKTIDFDELLAKTVVDGFRAAQAQSQKIDAPESSADA